MTRRQLFAAATGAPAKAAVAKDPDVIDWSEGKPIVGEFTLSEGALGYSPFASKWPVLFDSDGNILSAARFVGSTEFAVTTAPKPMK